MASDTFDIGASKPSTETGTRLKLFVMMVLQFFFAWKVMPETKGKSLEQIQHTIVH